jgi:hypothetical protein
MEWGNALHFFRHIWTGLFLPTRASWTAAPSRAGHVACSVREDERRRGDWTVEAGPLEDKMR